MADWSEMQLMFKLISAKSELMAKSNIRPWASDIQSAASEIAAYANRLSQMARDFEAADR